MITLMGKTYKDGDNQKIGAIAAAKFRDRYGEDAKPGQHLQQIKGRNCLTNHYRAKDHDILKEAVNECFS